MLTISLAAPPLMASLQLPIVLMRWQGRLFQWTIRLKELPQPPALGQSPLPYQEAALLSQPHLVAQMVVALSNYAVPGHAGLFG